MTMTSQKQEDKIRVMRRLSEKPGTNAACMKGLQFHITWYQTMFKKLFLMLF